MSSGLSVGHVLMAVALLAATVVTGAVIVIQIFSKPRRPGGGDDGRPSA